MGGAIYNFAASRPGAFRPSAPFVECGTSVPLALLLGVRAERLSSYQPITVKPVVLLRSLLVVVVKSFPGKEGYQEGGDRAVCDQTNKHPRKAPAWR